VKPGEVLVRASGLSVGSTLDRFDQAVPHRCWFVQHVCALVHEEVYVEVPSWHSPEVSSGQVGGLR
jgi:hypothetical protein